jgi:hypothetical protein
MVASDEQCMARCLYEECIIGSRKGSHMDCPTEGPQWEVRAAYRKGWEVGLAYYERLLSNIMQMLEAAQPIMKADDLIEELRYVGRGRALIELEDAWGTLSLKKSASLVPTDGQLPRQPESGRDDERRRR